MSVAIIKNSDFPEEAEFLTHPCGLRLIFKNHDDADNYLMANAESGVVYKQYDGEDQKYNGLAQVRAKASKAPLL